MSVEVVEGSFKLNQHKSDVDYVAVATALTKQGDAPRKRSELRWSRYARS